jgi:hypothetical protein
MGVGDQERLYRGPPHAWHLPLRARPMSFLLFAFATFVVLVEGIFVGAELAIHGLVLAPTARGFALLGIVLLVAANLKTVALALRREANESLAGVVDVALDRLWLMHFWLNPLGLFSLGLFLVFAPRAQPPFYYIAYGVLLWQAVGGLMAREAVPLKATQGEAARVARRAHHQPAVYVLLTVLVVAGWVDSIFP